MKKLLAIIGILFALSFAPLCLASSFNCPEHGWASCYDTGQIGWTADFKMKHLYSCSCGDSWWVIQ
jgi:hypothetical protein